MAIRDAKPAPMHFKTVIHADLPQGRNGKHKEIVNVILRDLQRLKEGAALKVPIADLPDTKENIRSALNRATRQRGLEISTSSDAEHLYVWKTEDRP